jgi:hypothetical protein
LTTGFCLYSLAAIPDTFRNTAPDINRTDSVAFTPTPIPIYKDTEGAMPDMPNDSKFAELSVELESARRYAHAAMAETEALRKTIVTLADDSRMDYLLDRLSVVSTM